MARNSKLRWEKDRKRSEGTNIQCREFEDSLLTTGSRALKGRKVGTRVAWCLDKGGTGAVDGPGGDPVFTGSAP